MISMETKGTNFFFIVMSFCLSTFLSCTDFEKTALPKNDRSLPICKDFNNESISLPGLAESPELQEILNIRIKLLRKTYAMDEFWIQFDKDLEEQ